jgi:adenine-specific DNA methylase
VPRDRRRQKALGAWYTPAVTARLLVKWAVPAAKTTVLDPAVGDGRFLIEAGRRLRELGARHAGEHLLGIDLNPEAVSATRRALAEDGARRARLVHGDFFAVEAPGARCAELPRVDAVVGNPPYIRYQSFAGAGRAAALARARDAGVRLSALCSSWAPFVVHAAQFLRTGGRLGLVLPEELLHTSYAAPVRDFLRRSFRRTAVIRFEGHLFPDSQERVVLLLAEGKGEAPAGELRLASADGPEAVRGLDKLVEGAERFGPDERPAKWQARFDDPGSAALESLLARGLLVPLGKLGKASIGYVSGANDFFVLTPSEAARRGFPKRALRWTVLAARQVPGAVLDGADLEALARRDERCRLWTGAWAGHRAVAAYAAEGEARGISARYKCRVRDPWYVVPGVSVPDAFLTYMSDVIPRLVLNRAGAACSNNLHAVRLGGMPDRLRARLVAGFYNSATMLSAERVGRHYGGGVLKLEPSEADRLLVPAPGALERARGLEKLLPRVDALLRAGKPAEALLLVDGALLVREFGMDARSLTALRASRARRQEGRAAARLAGRRRSAAGGSR